MVKLILIIINLLLVQSDVTSVRSKLLVVLLDGFRWDYVDNLSSSGGFKKLIKSGVKAHHMIPIYPSESYPNYFALTTGLYAENHCVISNYMLDPDKNIMFSVGEGKDSRRPSWFDKVEPVWITAERNNISTALFEWPSGEVPIRGIHPHISTPYKMRMSPYSLKSYLRRAVDLLASDKIGFSQVFMEWTDILGHSLGPTIMKTVLIPFFLDGIFLDFFNYVRQKKMDQSLNIIIVSDHGMTPTGPLSARSIDLEDMINVKDVRMAIDFGTHMGIYSEDGKEDKVYNQLKTITGLKVYKRDEIPDNYHLKHCNRVPPIYIEVLKGYYLLPLISKKKQVGTSVRFQIPAYHGYYPDNFSDMWGTFIASGPDFKKDTKVSAIYNVDVYNLMCHLLGIEALPNNGTWSHVKDMLISN